MEFLTKAECSELARDVGLGSDELLKRRGTATGLKRTSIFTYKSRMKNADAASRLLVQGLGDFTWAVLWPYEFPWGDRSQEEAPPADWREYARWRQSKGEARVLYEAPGHKFGLSERASAAKAIEFAIYTGWDAVAFASPLRALIRLSHDDYVEIHTRPQNDLSALSPALIELGLMPSQ